MLKRCGCIKVLIESDGRVLWGKCFEGQTKAYITTSPSISFSLSPSLSLSLSLSHSPSSNLAVCSVHTQASADPVQLSILKQLHLQILALFTPFTFNSLVNKNLQSFTSATGTVGVPAVANVKGMMKARGPRDGVG